MEMVSEKRANRKYIAWEKLLSTAFIGVLLSFNCSFSNALVLMDFESAYSTHDKQRIVQGDFEINMGGPYGFMQSFSRSATSSVPQSGSKFFQMSTPFRYPAILTARDGSAFDIVSIDLGEYSSVFRTPRTTTFTGVKASGEVLTQAFTVDGFFDGLGGSDDFETFMFGSNWTNLTRVEFGGGQTFDNIILRDSIFAEVAEPTTMGLMLAGFLSFITSRRRELKSR